MENKTIIFITGGPGTGKSRMAQKLIKEMSEVKICLLSYDAVKEKNWDRFGFENTADKDRLNFFSLEEFYLMIGKAMKDGETIMAEYPFYQRHRDELAALVARYGYRAVTVYLHTDMKTM